MHGLVAFEPAYEFSRRITQPGELADESAAVTAHHQMQPHCDSCAQRRFRELAG